jgi:predicted phage gp36 major capsid-like protein
MIKASIKTSLKFFGLITELKQKYPAEVKEAWDNLSEEHKKALRQLKRTKDANNDKLQN